MQDSRYMPQKQYGFPIQCSLNPGDSLEDNAGHGTVPIGGEESSRALDARHSTETPREQTDAREIALKNTPKAKLGLSVTT